MTFDPGWAKVTATTAGPANTHAAPKNPWALLTPVADGHMDVDFVLDVRTQFPTFKVRSSQPVRITSTPMRQP